VYNHEIFLMESIFLSRIINSDSAGKERTRLTKAVVLAIRELAQLNEPGTEARDLAAFIAIALSIVGETIDVSVAAWEKRGYWVKADRFRMDWDWAVQVSGKMRTSVLAGDWPGVAQAAAMTAQKLNKVIVPAKHRLGRPWVGAWNELQKS
jgi:hypothetical protein